MTATYQKIKGYARIYKMPANQNDAPVYRVIPSAVPYNNSNVPMKAALEAVKKMLTVVRGDK